MNNEPIQQPSTRNRKRKRPSMDHTEPKTKRLCLGNVKSLPVSSMSVMYHTMLRFIPGMSIQELQHKPDDYCAKHGVWNVFRKQCSVPISQATLMLAIQRGPADVIPLLTQSPYNLKVDSVEKISSPLLYFAIERNREDVMTAVLNLGVSMTLPRGYELATTPNPLLYACKRHRIQAFRTMLHQRTDELLDKEKKKKDIFHETLNQICQSNNYECLVIMMDFLQQHSVAWDIASSLLFVSQHKDLRCARLLLETYITMFPSLKNTINVGSAMNCALGARNIDFIELLVHFGIDIYQPDQFGINILIDLCYLDEPKLLDRILRIQPTDVNLSDLNGDTPLHVACRHNAFRCIDVLFRHARGQINVTRQNIKGETPYYVAKSFKRKRCMDRIHKYMCEFIQ